MTICLVSNDLRGPDVPVTLMRQVRCSHVGCIEPVVYFVSTAEAIVFYCAQHRDRDIPLAEPREFTYPVC